MIHIFNKQQIQTPSVFFISLSLRSSPRRTRTTVQSVSMQQEVLLKVSASAGLGFVFVEALFCFGFFFTVFVNGVNFQLISPLCHLFL